MRWNACMHRLDLGLYSHPKAFWGNGGRTHVNSNGKIPSTRKKILRGRPNPRRCITQDSECNTLPADLFRPQPFNKHANKQTKHTHKNKTTATTTKSKPKPKKSFLEAFPPAAVISQEHEVPSCKHQNSNIAFLSSSSWRLQSTRSRSLGR